MVEGSQGGAQTRLGWVTQDLQLSMVPDSSRIGIETKEHQEYMVVQERGGALTWSSKAPTRITGQSPTGP